MLQVALSQRRMHFIQNFHSHYAIFLNEKLSWCQHIQNFPTNGAHDLEILISNSCQAPDCDTPQYQTHRRQKRHGSKIAGTFDCRINICSLRICHQKLHSAFGTYTESMQPFHPIGSAVHLRIRSFTDAGMSDYIVIIQSRLPHTKLCLRHQESATTLVS